MKRERPNTSLKLAMTWRKYGERSSHGVGCMSPVASSLSPPPAEMSGSAELPLVLSGWRRHCALSSKASSWARRATSNRSGNGMNGASSFMAAVRGRL